MGGYDLVRPLGLGGISTGLLVQKPSDVMAARSRFTRSVLPVPNHPWDDEESIIAAMMRWASAQPEPPVLYYQYDPSLLFVSRNRERLSQAFRFVVAEAELVEDLVNKGRFQALAERLGLPVPPTRLINAAETLEPPDLDLRFPVILKPLTRESEFVNQVQGAKALAIASPDVFRANWGQLAQFGPCLIQEMIPGAETCIESYHAYVAEDGEIVGEFTGRKVRTRPATYGFSTAVEVSDAPDVLALGRDVVAALGLTGVLKADFKRAPDGRLYLLEINPRYNLWHYLGAAAGVNLPALVHADLCGYPRPARRPATIGARWCDVRLDYAAARESGVSTGAWLRWMLPAAVKTPWAIDEPGIWRMAAKPWMSRFGRSIRRRFPGRQAPPLGAR